MTEIAQEPAVTLESNLTQVLEKNRALKGKQNTPAPSITEQLKDPLLDDPDAKAKIDAELAAKDKEIKEEKKVVKTAESEEKKKKNQSTKSHWTGKVEEAPAAATTTTTATSTGLTADERKELEELRGLKDSEEYKVASTLKNYEGGMKAFFKDINETDVDDLSDDQVVASIVKKTLGKRAEGLSKDDFDRKVQDYQNSVNEIVLLREIEAEKAAMQAKREKLFQSVKPASVVEKENVSREMETALKDIRGKEVMGLLITDDMADKLEKSYHENPIVAIKNGKIDMKKSIELHVGDALRTNVLENLITAFLDGEFEEEVARLQGKTLRVGSAEKKADDKATPKDKQKQAQNTLMESLIANS